VPRLRGLLLRLFVVALALALLEGISSLILFVWSIAETPRVGESYHTQYDPDLGWAHRRSLSLPNMYGRGIGLTTNAQGFRAKSDVGPAVPAGKTRIVCSGDSFTLGYGVGDDDTWCAVLARMEPGFDTVNMGQAGYGLDQSYLWYQRDGRDLHANVQLFAFISDDFNRMSDAERMGYGKPFLDVEEERLVIRNTPVPKRAWVVPWLTRNLESIRALRTFALLGRVIHRAAAPASTQAAAGPKAPVRRIVSKMLDNLAEIHQAQGSQLVLVFLPYLPEHGVTPGWLPFMRTEAERLRVPFINVSAELNKLSRADAEALFIPDGPGTYPGAGGHLSARGNQYVARVVYEKLREILSAR
jgi:lysophospholipase L1-like esterase